MKSFVALALLFFCLCAFPPVSDAQTKPKKNQPLLYSDTAIALRPGIVPPSDQPFLISAGALLSSPEVLQKEISSRYSGKFVHRAGSRRLLGACRAHMDLSWTA